MLSERDDAHTMLTTVSGTRRPAPLGRAAHPNSKSEAYLHDLLSDVAGKELFRAGLKVNVRCQPGKRPLWTKDETIFVDPSLLNVLTRKEELAFVLAQQAVLLMAGADKNGVQFGADQMAVDLMIGAGLAMPVVSTTIASNGLPPRASCSLSTRVRSARTLQQTQPFCTLE